jgi:hypothetical protein
MNGPEDYIEENYESEFEHIPDDLPFDFEEGEDGRYFD